MWLIKTKIDRSTIHGIGLFADENVHVGQRVWQPNKAFDIPVPDDYEDHLVLLPSWSRNLFLKRTYIDPKSGKRMFGIDGDSFVNHSDIPNVEFDCFGVGYAKMDIMSGEEITNDYSQIHDGDPWEGCGEGEPEAAGGTR